MTKQDFAACRLFVESDLARGLCVELSREQAHYLRHVLRLGNGAGLRVFNGRDGEWLARLAGEGKRAAKLELIEMTRPQTKPGDLHLLFAPLKQARLDYMVQKAVEMGASRLVPVITRHTQVSSARSGALASERDRGRRAVWHHFACRRPSRRSRSPTRSARSSRIGCSSSVTRPPSATILFARSGPGRRGPVAVLVGPEGGFAEEERRSLLERPATLRLSLGPRIMRADTAAVAALALVQACLGDWSPRDG